MAGQGVGFSELSSPSNGSDNTKRPGTPQITPSELTRPVNLQRIVQRKAQIKTYPVRKKLEKLGVYSSCKVKVTWPHFIVYAHWSGMMEKSFIFLYKRTFFHCWWYLGFFECWNPIMLLFSLFPVGSHSPSMIFFGFSSSILKVVGMKWVKVRRHHKTCKLLQNDGECVVPENIHTSPTEYSLLCTHLPQGVYVPGGLWWPPSLQEFPELLNGDFLPPSEIQSRFNALTHSLLEILPKNAFWS